MMVPALKLDPNQTLEEIKAAMKDIVTIYDSIDIVVNNAGYVQTGILEEVTPEATFRQFQVNTFGPLNGFCAVLPSFTKFHAAELDNPVKNMEIIYDVVTSSGHAAGRDLLALGSDAIAEISKPASQTLTDLKAWQEINVISDFSDEQ
ncbi:3-oxoacyl-[acyl-carrier-protein] reductase [Blastomyces dermatitidis ATCC 18188]|uniref:3-oxoacyl-[acyl-carrier-protein] reductase n=1 Tax=Ajellomyces dermatitidis (strain ATCC 18188 / CBS 674.68) TaxID=653446 RepID=F2TT36_AJEDA|nr:3-oxoacyl-[acyl-carrier-protein] reductase [Blastomyces dermatitidis ATCC 18188]